MDIKIEHGPGNAAAEVRLGGGETVTAEAGAMIAMSGGMEITTSTHKKQSGSILAGLKRLLVGESFFLNHFTAPEGGGHVWLAATLPGDMTQIELGGDRGLVVQGGSFVAADPTVSLDLGWQGLKSMFSGEGLFWIRLGGTGKVVINSFGAIYSVDVEDEYIVDTGHIVAFEDTLSFKISKAGSSWISSMLGGEGVVCRFQGAGRVWCQSHDAPGFGRTLGPKLRSRS